MNLLEELICTSTESFAAVGPTEFWVNSVNSQYFSSLAQLRNRLSICIFFSGSESIAQVFAAETANVRTKELWDPSLSAGIVYVIENHEASTSRTSKTVNTGASTVNDNIVSSRRTTAVENCPTHSIDCCVFYRQQRQQCPNTPES